AAVFGGESTEGKSFIAHVIESGRAAVAEGTAGLVGSKGILCAAAVQQGNTVLIERAVGSVDLPSRCRDAWIGRYGDYAVGSGQAANEQAVVVRTESAREV